jgi:hypothetical protein
VGSKWRKVLGVKKSIGQHFGRFFQIYLVTLWPLAAWPSGIITDFVVAGREVESRQKNWRIPSSAFFSCTFLPHSLSTLKAAKRNWRLCTKTFVAETQGRATGDRCYDLLNIFAENYCKKIGVF